MAYYSAQGHTRTVAQTLVDELGADLFTIDNDFTGKGPSPSTPPRRPAWANRSQPLAKAADSGEWQDGQRFSSGASEDEVRTWAKTL